MAYKTPGVFVEEIAKLPPSIAEVETAIPAFIGYTQLQGKSGKPVQTVDTAHVEVVRLSSMLEYETFFGTADATNIQVSITDTDGVRSVSAASLVGSAPVNTMYYHLQMYFANGGGPCYIVSVNVANGIIKDSELKAGLDIIAQYDEPTLLVFPEGVSVDGNNETNRAIALYGLYDLALQQAAALKDRFVIMDCFRSSTPGTDDIDVFRDNTTTNNLKYGAAYYPFLNTTLGYVFSDTSVQISLNGSPYTLATVAAVDNSAYNLARQAAAALSITLNPSAAIAGVYAAVDSNRGVWKAPANVSLNYVVSPSVAISDEDQRNLNVDTTAGKSINAIRLFTGKGTLVWGARTLAGNDNEWRYVPVRRFFNMVEESTKKATGAFVFEPNDANTWTKVQGMIENYLLTLWRAGALQGAKPEHAFYVSVGLGKTMTAQDILEGRMYVEIGMAAVRPAEFIILRFSHMMAQS